jgi:hypothetical protein
MTTDRDFERISRAWLDLMPNEAPDRAVDAVLQAVETTPQQRSVRLFGRRRSPMHRLVLVATAAMLGVALVGGALFLAGSRPSDSSEPTPSPLESPPTAVEGGGAPDALRADWIATSNGHPMLGNAPGIVGMSVGPSGADISSSNFGAGHGYASTVTQTGGDELELTLVADGDECAAGDRGTYRWTLSEDRAELTLTLLTEDCMKRGIVFGRTWARSLTGATSVGTGVVNTMEPTFKISLPDATYESRTLTDFFEVGSANGIGLMVHKNPQPFVDACSTDEERVPYTPGAAAFVEAFRNNDAFNVGPETTLTIDGHPAINVVVEGKPNYARCPGQPLYQYTPKECNCHFIVGQGDADSMYLVDVDGDTFLFIVSPISSPNEREIVDSIRIPYQLPGQ